MNLEEYQKKAKSLAIYSDKYALLYPALGIVGECGEVAEKIKKMFRDDDGSMTQKRKDAILKELGDCCWYLANICCNTDMCLQVIYEMRGSATIHAIRNLTVARLVLWMNRHANSLAEILEQQHYLGKDNFHPREKYTEIPRHISHIITCIDTLGHTCGFTLKDIYTANIDKLTSRKERGVLGGDGDQR